MVKIINIKLITKNSKQNKCYLYQPVVQINDNYYYAETVKTSKRITKNDIDVKSIKTTRLIPPELYKVNGIIS